LQNSLTKNSWLPRGNVYAPDVERPSAANCRVFPVRRQRDYYATDERAGVLPGMPGSVPAGVDAASEREGAPAKADGPGERKQWEERKCQGTKKYELIYPI
jgi:hypothetical protein